jgi:hypothetical protein
MILGKHELALALAITYFPQTCRVTLDPVIR